MPAHAADLPIAGKPIDSPSATPRNFVPAQPSSVPDPVRNTPAADDTATKAARPLVAVKTAANIRRFPDPSSPVVQIAHAGERLNVFDRRKGWIQVGKDEPIGWIAGSLVIE